ncbi:sensor histidine kinase [Hoyosella rhizosphaerae]|uniref:histidine kinase n=1 Tax=Hoyosella rhizosphaerae TaxID=1755582 RepID=A0A916UA40_9ACTN|nr:sensor histidine kinase [Hoyosella rhizosphaerae]MBN4926022.1 sensor histidine kinase [Hoyosella rhizosphaerae]GGC66157.1 two-component sensor histidine kinase [Hoyosella rhizosphaerae]
MNWAPSASTWRRRSGASFVERWFAFTRRHWLGIDIGLAAFVTLFGLFGVLAGASHPIDLVVALGLTIPLAWRRMRPALSGYTVAAFAFLSLAVSDTNPPAAVGVLFALYGLAAYSSPLASRLAYPLAIVGMSLAALAPSMSYERSFGATVINVAFASAVATAVYLSGLVRRYRINEVAGLTERARLLEIEREQETRLAAITERTRIAREMHDIVAHSLTVVIAQADGGRYAAKSDVGAAIDALTQISATGRQALTDMRALLSVLRDDSPRETSSTPQVGDIAALVKEVRRSGLDIAVNTEGEPRELPSGVSLTAYRIVQESLTNVLKHAGPIATVSIDMHWTNDALKLEVVDDGKGIAGILPKAEGVGQGIRGMQERARLYGGVVDAQPTASGGYKVSATLPYSQ